MSLLKSYLESELATMLENNIRLRCIGRKKNLPAEVGATLDAYTHTLRQNIGR